MKNLARIIAATAVTLAVSTYSARAQDIKIGMSGPTSGAEAYFGNTWMNGMELAIRQANEAGGIGGQKLAFQREDDGGDPKQGTLVAQKHYWTVADADYERAARDGGAESGARSAQNAAQPERAANGGNSHESTATPVGCAASATSSEPLLIAAN